MSEWEKTEHFKQTEFGPMKTGETITYRDCSKCEALQAKFDRAVEALEKIANHWSDYELNEMSFEGQCAHEALQAIKESK